MTAIIGLIVFFAIALIGWGVAELKSKQVYTHSSEEAAEEKELAEVYKEMGSREWNLKDLLKHNSTKGYKAI